MNFKLTYLYRDAGNWKNYNSVVFCSSTKLSEAISLLCNEFIDNLYFDPVWCKLPRITFDEYNAELDLGLFLHEFDELDYTNENVNFDCTFEEILDLLRTKNVITAFIQHNKN